MGAKGWIIFSAIAIGLLGLLVYFSGQSKVDVSQYDFDKIIAANETNGNIGDHIIGDPKSSVVFIEYGDFQCPGCASVNPSIKELTEKYKDNIAFIFRNKPLPEIHPNARYAAAVAEAAGLQGKYWQMHSLLYQAQNEWSGISAADRGTFFEGYARQLGLNVEKLNEDVASDNITKKINFDIAISREKNINSTPSFFLNGEAVSQDTWGDQDKLEKTLRDAIIASGVELEDETEEK